MVSLSIVLVLLLGYCLNCLVNGEETAAGGKGMISDGSKELSRFQRDTGIPTEYKGVCGVPPVQIDKRYESCDYGVIVSKPRSATSTSTARIESSTSTPKEICRGGYLQCNGKIFCGDQGFQCCGFERYDPGIQTCCQYTSAKYRVYDDKPEKDHICCGVQVYKRGTVDIPCEHASSNDKFFQKTTNIKMKMLKETKEYCSTNEFERVYIYKIDVEYQDTVDSNQRYLKALVSMWPWKPATRSKKITHLRRASTRRAEMELPLDKYSPGKKNLVGKSFFTITKKNYLAKGVFFLSPSDKLYKWPKSVKRQRKITKSLKKVRRQCRQQQNNKIEPKKTLF